MAKTFILHDESVNTYGFRMLTEGANLDEFRKNPVMLLNHNDWTLPIGRWDNIRVEGTKILADAVFDLEDANGKAVASKVEAGFLRMASIGAWAPEVVSDDPLLKLDGQTGVTVLRWTVREASIVTIGANHNALALYDRDSGESIDLSDHATLVKLMDVKPSNNTTLMTINQLLKLSDNASAADQERAVSELIAERDRLQEANKTLSDAIDKHNQDRKEQLKTEAVALIDAAVADGRINASSKESYIKLFDADHDSAKAALGAIPKRVSVSAQIDSGRSGGGVNLADLETKSWDELDKAGKLVILRDQSPEVYATKFKERFGVELKK